MLRAFIIFSLITFSFNSYAEKCEGLNACIELYTKLTGHKLIPGPSISDELSLAVSDVDLTETNADKEFKKFLNKNTISLNGDRMMVNRFGEFISAPVYVVSEGNIPRMMDAKGLVTLVYHAQGNSKKLASDAAKMSSKKMSKPKSVNSVIDFGETKIISVSDSYEVAVKIVKQIMKKDK